MEGRRYRRDVVRVRKDPYSGMGWWRAAAVVYRWALPCYVRELLRPSGFCGLYWQTVDSLIAIPCSCGTNDNYAARELVQGARRKEDGRLRENKGQKVRAMRSQRDRVL